MCLKGVKISFLWRELSLFFIFLCRHVNESGFFPELENPYMARLVGL
ncbi:hypothetical protein HHE02_09370 [Helicobacter heilmannii]|uniref:Uncharacterized protein n=1 Tax=Helicobacter heilmannii TaxID=35817 RepID=A0A0K2XTV1_HELHE|nr:hypothetical protein BN341_18920 [Helicobacter heilmannii ASB1.4]CRF45779.1 hypothetical protein HHE014_07530 [Helicobacter heilmannii]CRF47644.1 hypothetical protein HHE02_09370 [Helicobacter heilmannii]CRF50033.1 hypothetical protein HHE03_17280 [Helicobacter heilmannii]CRF51699.1 hypothetical protein HHE06_15930 [Helicobacter heilmannii]